MEAIANTSLVLHFLGLAALLGGVLTQITTPLKKISNGMLHGALLSLLSGIVMVGIRYPLNDQSPLKFPLFDNSKVAVKFLILVVILILGYNSKKKSKSTPESADKVGWATVGILTFTNIVIAVFW